MKVGDKIRMALRTFLKIQPPGVQSYQINELFDWQGNAIKNRIWYRGDGAELNQFYRQMLDKTTHSFWASVPTHGMEVRRIRQEQGLEDLEEPSAGAEVVVGGFGG